MLRGKTPKDLEDDFSDIGSDTSSDSDDEVVSSKLDSSFASVENDNALDKSLTESFFSLDDAVENKPLPKETSVKSKVKKDEPKIVPPTVTPNAKITVERKEYSASKLALLHLKRFFEDKNLKLVSATRSADHEGISDGIVFYTFQDKKTGDFVHAFYPTCDTDKHDATTTDVIDLNHALAIYNATVGQQKGGKKHRLFIPVATRQKARDWGFWHATNHWLEFYSEVSANNATATLTDSFNRPYDTAYIEKSVKHLNVFKLNHVKTGYQHNSVDCGPHFLINSDYSYNGGNHSRIKEITDPMLLANDKIFKDWNEKNKRNERDEKTKKQSQSIPYSSGHKFVAPDDVDVVDQTVALSEVTIQIRSKSEIKPLAYKHNFVREFGPGAIKVQHLTSHVKDNSLWSEDYVSLYTDEVTQGDSELKAWVNQNAHADGMIGDLIVELFPVFGRGFHFSNYQIPLDAKEKADNAQCALYRDKKDPNSIYFEAYIPYGQVNISTDELTVEGNAQDTRSIGNKKSIIATYNILLKATKTNKGIVTTVEYANITAHHPDLIPHFKKAAKEANKAIVPTVRTKVAIDENEKIEAENNLKNRLRILIQSLALDAETADLFNKDPITYMRDIIRLANEQKKAKESAVANSEPAPVMQPAPQQPQKISLTAQQIEEHVKMAEILEEEVEKKQAILNKVYLLKGGKAQEKYLKDLHNLVALEKEIDGQLLLQDDLLSKLESFKQCIPVGMLARFQLQPLENKKDIDETIDQLKGLIEKVNSLKGLDESVKAKLLGNPMQFEGDINGFADLQNELLRMVVSFENVEPNILRLYQSETLKFEKEIKEEYAKGLIKKLSILKNVTQEEMKDCTSKPLDNEQKILSLYSLQVQRNELIRSMNKIVFARVNRWNEFVKAIPSAKQGAKSSRLFSSFDERRLAKGHFKRFTSFSYVAAEKMQSRVNASKDIDGEEMKFLLLDILDSIIETAKSHLVKMHEKGSALRKGSCLVSFMSYIEELEKDVRKFAKTGSIADLIVDDKELPKISDTVTKKQLSSNFSAIKEKVQTRENKIIPGKA